MSERKKLEWLELGRGIAAFSVLLCHGSENGFPSQLSFLAYWGEWGVCFFFVLSGFIIHHVHSNDLGMPSRAANFAWRRFLRIFPTYWLILLAALFANRFLGNPDYIIAVDAEFILKNFLLLPDGILFVSPAWTLRHEILFYGLFLIAILNFRLGIALFVAWFLAIVAHVFYVGLDTGPYHPTSETLMGYRNLFFFIGIAMSVAYKHGYSDGAVWASFAAVIACVFANQVLADDWAYASLQLSICALGIAVAVKLSECGYSLPAVALWLGAISYPLYLVHRLSFIVAHGIIKRTGVFVLDRWQLQFVLGLSIALVASHLIHAVFEKRIFRLHGIIKNRRSRSSEHGDFNDSATQVFHQRHR